MSQFIPEPIGTRSFPFVKLDVFTRRPLEGNQLAVITDAHGLNDHEMQALAREMNLSETTFIFPRDEKTERTKGVKVRIFTVNEELPFAGHPTLGTALVLRGSSNAEEIQLDLPAGKIPVCFSQREGAIFGEMTQRDPEFGSIHSKELVARDALSWSAAQLDAQLPVQTVTTGMAFAIVPVASVEILSRLTLDWKRAAAYLEKTDAKFFYFIARDLSTGPNRFRARMIFYNGEDPATGSAAGCATAWMVLHGMISSDEQAVIEQGVEMKRPSQIFVRGTKTANGVSNIRVGGYGLEIMRGKIELQTQEPS